MLSKLVGISIGYPNTFYLVNYRVPLIVFRFLMSLFIESQTHVHKILSICFLDRKTMRDPPYLEYFQVTCFLQIQDARALPAFQP